MSHIYNNSNNVNNSVYCEYDNIISCFSPRFSQKTIWLDSREITKLLIENNLLTENEILNLRDMYNEYNNPMAILGK